MEILLTLFLLGFLVTSLLVPATKILKEHERGVIFRLGRLLGVRGPGVIFIIPVLEQMVRVDLRVTTLDVPAQACVTRDRATLQVGAKLHYQVYDPQRAVVQVHDFRQATRQAAQTSLSDVVGQRGRDELLAQSEQVSAQLQALLEQQANAWGVRVSRAEITGF